MSRGVIWDIVFDDITTPFRESKENSGAQENPAQLSVEAIRLRGLTDIPVMMIKVGQTVIPVHLAVPVHILLRDTRFDFFAAETCVHATWIWVHGEVQAIQDIDV